MPNGYKEVELIARAVGSSNEGTSLYTNIVSDIKIGLPSVLIRLSYYTVLSFF